MRWRQFVVCLPGVLFNRFKTCPFSPARRAWCYVAPLLALFLVKGFCGTIPLDLDVQTPAIGDHTLHILSPNLLELVLVNTKDPDPARVDSWDWVNDQQLFVPPDLSSIRVLVNSRTNVISGVGFKRRPVYAPFLTWDLRIGNRLYLQLSNPIADSAAVKVLNNGTLWPTNMAFAAVADPLRYNPAIHVNQEGYMPDYPKKAAV